MADISKGGSKVTRSQVLLIGALTITLIGAVFYGQSGNKPPVTKIAAAASSPAAAIVGASSVNPVAKVSWPDVSLENTLQHNPFAPRSSSDQTKTDDADAGMANKGSPPSAASDEDAGKEALNERQQGMLAELKSKKVRMI